MRKYLIVAMLFCCSIAFAQNIKRPDTYNYNRGVEAIQNNNAEEALEYPVSYTHLTLPTIGLV